MRFPDQETQYMALAIKEAARAHGKTSPNPCVGAVVVKSGQVVGRGFHRRPGTPHAEVNALKNAGGRARGATLYVTLEPCNHTGRTPPCTRAILDAGIRRVVVGMEDPNPRVAGGGCSFLRHQGVAVVSGLLEQECRALNRPFITYCETGLPWVVMKGAMSLDGRIAAGHNTQTRISNDRAHRLAHQLRHTHDAILVGIRTVLTDNPRLTTRLAGKKGRDPVRVILDSSLRLPVESKVVRRSSPSPTVVFCSKEADSAKLEKLAAHGVQVHRVAMDSKGLALDEVLRILGAMGVTTLLVEGGGRVHGAFLASRLLDYGYLFVAPCFLGREGVPLIDDRPAGNSGAFPAPSLVRTRKIDDNLLIELDFSG